MKQMKLEDFTEQVEAFAGFIEHKFIDATIGHVDGVTYAIDNEEESSLEATVKIVKSGLEFFIPIALSSERKDMVVVNSGGKEIDLDLWEARASMGRSGCTIGRQQENI